MMSRGIRSVVLLVFCLAARGQEPAQLAENGEQNAQPNAEQNAQMTIERLFEVAGARSAAASRGRFSARVTEYRCMVPGQAAADAYAAYTQHLHVLLDELGPNAELNAAQVAPDRKTWAVDTWYELDYAYQGGRYRLSRVAPNGTYHEAFDGVAAFRVQQRTMYIERAHEHAEPVSNLDVSLMRWDLIPKNAYVRDDQDFEVRRLGDNSYNLWLHNKKTGATVDQVFNAGTGMLERATLRDAQDRVLQEHLWLRPVNDGAWLPSVFIKMDRAGQNLQLEVRVYSYWQARPLEDGELAIPADAYDTVASLAFPEWREVAVQQRNATRAAVKAVQDQFDEQLLKQTPPQSYVMRTMGMILIGLAVILIVLWAVRWRVRGM